MKVITWSTKLVDVKLIKATPNNFKLKTELGKERLQASLKSFGLAGTVICNTDYTLIDGNSRLEQAREKGEKKIWVSLPSRKLSPSEFREMAAMYDFAKAGEVDVERIEKELGTTKDFFEKYKMTIPMALLDKLGNNAPVELDYPEPKKGAEKIEVSDIKMVQLFFSEKQEAEFRKIEAQLMKRFKTANTTDTVLKAYKQLMK